MKNLSVRIKMSMITILVVILSVAACLISLTDLQQVKQKSLDELEVSIRENYDTTIKDQVGVVISLLSEINDQYKAGVFESIDEAKALQQRKSVRCVMEIPDISGLIHRTEPMWYFLEEIRKEPIEWKPRTVTDIRW